MGQMAEARSTPTPADDAVDVECDKEVEIGLTVLEEEEFGIVGAESRNKEEKSGDNQRLLAAESSSAKQKTRQSTTQK